MKQNLVFFSLRALKRLKPFVRLFLSCILLVSCAYKIEILQGSIITTDDVSQLEIGMSKAQIEYILGTPSIVNPINPDRWDYVFRSKQGQRINEKKGYLIFYDNSLREIYMDEFITDI